MAMTSKQTAESWLLHGERDLGFARLGMNVGYLSQACFMAHQSMEKGLKAILFLQGARYISPSSLAQLLERVSHSRASLQRFEEHAQKLDGCYETARHLESLATGLPNEGFEQEETRAVVAEGEALNYEIRNIIRLAR